MRRCARGKGDGDSYRRDQSDGQQESDDSRGAFGERAGRRRDRAETFTASGSVVEARGRV